MRKQTKMWPLLLMFVWMLAFCTGLVLELFNIKVGDWLAWSVIKIAEFIIVMVFFLNTDWRINFTTPSKQ